MRAILAVLLAVSVLQISGHGSENETVGPVQIHGRDANLEISSSSDDPELDGDQISLSLIDAESEITLRDVVFSISAERGERHLFDQRLDAAHGFIVFDFVPGDGPVTVEEAEQSNFFANLFGFESRLVRVAGPGLGSGGLYKFAVSVVEADGRPLDPPVELAAGVSIPEETRFDVRDPNYGDQYIDVITYYDTISGFSYDPATRRITYEMPFEWSEENINQTLVLHEEVAFPKGFGDLLASGFVMEINGLRVADEAINVDDFAAGSRIVHFTVFREELLRLMGETDRDGMSFLIRPDRDDIHLSGVTENGQFRVYVAPGTISPGGDASIEFEVTDVFLRGAPISTEYDLRVSQGDTILHEQSGTSSGERGAPDVAEFPVPAGAPGIIDVSMSLDGNDRASVSFPLVSGRAVQAVEGREAGAEWASGGDIAGMLEAASRISGAEVLDLPEWLKGPVSEWSRGALGDEWLGDTVRYLASRGILS
ncbi:MAG: peptidase [Nitrosopumilus sp.]|nr:peptidase [Nitrosopumilus sp.]